MANDLYATHLQPLRLACERTIGPVVEFGCGFHSTGYLASLASLGRHCVSYENSEGWAERVQEFAAAGVVLACVPDLVAVARELHDDWAVCLVDSAPECERKQIIDAMRHKAKAIVVHDTEPAAEACYGMAETLKSFKHSKTFHHDEGNATTILSERIDVRFW